MGCACSLPYPRTVTVKIEYHVSKDYETASLNKILMLGPGESGKSTIVKQMRIIHGAGYSEIERMNFRSIVHTNAIEGLDTILQAREKLQISFEDETALQYVQRFDYLKKMGHTSGITNELGHLMMILWKDKAVKNCFARSSEYQLSDSAGYFLNNLPKLCQPDFIPTNHDVLQARVRTTGILEYRFVCKGFPFLMVDVGGQRSQRKKWLHCFDDITGIIIDISLFCLLKYIYQCIGALPNIKFSIFNL